MKANYKIILISFFVTLTLIMGFLNVPPQWLKYFSFAHYSNKLGVAVTTISTATNLADFPDIYNADIPALNDGKIENASSSIAAITTLSNLVTVGTLTSGTWNADTLTVSSGGTGSTTLSANQVLLGNGTSGVLTVTGWGTSGQFLTSNGVATAPTWQTSAIDEALGYTWTGNHIWSSGASSTLFGILDTLYVGRTASSTIQGSTSGTSALQGYLNVLGTSGTSTVTSNFYTQGNLTVDGTASTSALIVDGAITTDTCSGCAQFANFATSTGAISADQTNVITVGFRPKLITGTVDLSGNTNDDAVCFFHSYEDAESYIGDPTAAGLFDRENSLICRSNQATDDMTASITAVSDTGFTLQYTITAGAFNNIAINATIVGE